MVEGKVVMISGGSKGLGAALTRRFVGEGASVSICARGPRELDALADELRSNGGSVLATSIDVSSEPDVAGWVQATRDRFGRIDALINNASLLGPRAGIESYPLDVWRSVVEINLTGAFLCAREIIPSLRETKGAMVHVSSGVGNHGRPFWGAYSASKNGLEALSEMLAGELAEDGIRSNAVDPGKMRTAMRAAAYPDEDPLTLPLPSEVVEVFLYLVSDAARDVTGQRFQAQNFEVPG
ncbi:MAG: SDR family oxidoreductase [Gemmatimonadales bacterium]|nr:MAG: SDR family oxidoreductase [Gemmatimonadales bacterium]